MPWRGKRLVTVAAGLGFVALAFAWSGSAGEPPDKGKVPFKQGAKIAGERGLAPLLKTHPRIQPRSKVEGPKDLKVNPNAAVEQTTLPIPKPAVKARVPVRTGQTLEGGRSDPLKGAGLPVLPGPRTIKSTARRAGAKDFTIFRNQAVYDGGNASEIGEPSIGNDRNAILFTGNKYAAVSTDNGINFSHVDPFDTSVFPNADGGFCCDQLVNASDEDDGELIAWLQQYKDDGNENTIRLVTYRGKSDVELHLEQQTTGTDVSAFCYYDFQPEDFDLGGDRELDYEVMENSDEWLYITSNVFKLSNGSSKGYVLWRIKLDDLTDSDCSLEHDWEFMVDSDHFSARLVQGAGSKMWWAAHHGSSHGKLRLFWVSDSSTDVDYDTVNVTNYKVFTDSDEGECETPDNNNPCKRMDDRLQAGWLAGDTVGFLWMARQGGDYPYPYVRGARFKTSDRSLEAEPVIWSENTAWAYPSVGVNSEGHLGIALYYMGGDYYPGINVFLVDNYSNWDDLDLHYVYESKYAPDDNEWGDYTRVVRYDGCSKTFAGAVYTMQDGRDFGDAEGRFVWFGREGNGCADLVVEDISASLSGRTISIADTTRNIGSGTAKASHTRFYLSRDQEQGSSDIKIHERHAVPELARTASDAESISADIPEEAGFGAYYVIACADDEEVVEEITNTNNCRATSGTIQVPLDVTKLIPKDFSLLGVAGLLGSASQGSKFDLTTRVRLRGSDTEAKPAVVDLYLSNLRVVDPDKIKIGSYRVVEWRPIPLPPLRPPRPPRPGPRPELVKMFGFESMPRVSVTIPERVAPGRYYVVACVAAEEAGVDDASLRDNCTSSRTRIRILPGR